MSKEKVFLRNATGLVRAFSTVDAFFLAAGQVIALGWIAVFAAIWFLFPGVRIPGSLAIIGIFAVFNGLYYIYVSAVMPRTAGGGYVPLSRTIHPIVGLGTSFVLATALILTASFNASSIPVLSKYTGRLRATQPSSL